MESPFHVRQTKSEAMVDELRRSSSGKYRLNGSRSKSLTTRTEPPLETESKALKVREEPFSESLANLSGPPFFQISPLAKDLENKPETDEEKRDRMLGIRDKLSLDNVEVQFQALQDMMDVLVISRTAFYFLIVTASYGDVFREVKGLLLIVDMTQRKKGRTPEFFLQVIRCVSVLVEFNGNRSHDPSFLR